MKEKESSACSNRKKCSKAVMLNRRLYRWAAPRSVFVRGLINGFQDLVVHKGFTLLEVIVAIIIIGALLAFALPKYETALDKSRFSTLMPLTKSIKDAEEVFYIASNQYTEDVSSLDVKVNPGETVQVSVKDDDDYSYVQAIDPRIENIYKAYLKHSTNFPEERHCEALTDSTRAKKVCETLGGTLLDESGAYTVYVLEGTGNGNVNTEKQCEGETPSTEQACSSGCGTQTRSVSCDTSTGEWELGEWTGTCPEQGETTQNCTSGVGTETRTFTCEGDTWVAGEWDTSSCTCDPEKKPDEEQACTHGGTMTRTVTCNGTTWEADEAWDKSNCACDPDSEPSTEQTCDSGCGSQTRENTCVNGQWKEGTWQGGCTEKPDATQSCSDGCRTGTQTRSVTCSNGAWVTGSYGTCSVTKPADSSSSCSDTTANGYYYTGGTKTRSYTCSNGSWKLSSTYDYSGCTGGCSNSSKPSTSENCTTVNSCYYRSGTVYYDVWCENGTWQQSENSNTCQVWDCGAKPADDGEIIDVAKGQMICEYLTCCAGTWYKSCYCYGGSCCVSYSGGHCVLPEL